MEVPITSFFFSSRRRHTRCGRDWSSTCALPIFTSSQALASKTEIVSLFPIPAGTSAVIVLSSTIVKLVASTVPNFTSVVPVNPDPVMVIIVPAGPELGRKEVMDAMGVHTTIGSQIISTFPIWTLLPETVLNSIIGSAGTDVKVNTTSSKEVDREVTNCEVPFTVTVTSVSEALQPFALNFNVMSPAVTPVAVVEIEPALLPEANLIVFVGEPS